MTIGNLVIPDLIRDRGQCFRRWPAPGHCGGAFQREGEPRPYPPAFSASSAGVRTCGSVSGSPFFAYQT